MRMMRSAICAISSLCVIITMVWENCWLVTFNRPMTSRLVRLSRFPVGSSARIMAGFAASARALAAKPAIILADEPTGNLDSRTSQDVMSLLKVTSEKFSQTIVMITHNEEIAQMADRIIRIEDGKIVSRG